MKVFKRLLTLLRVAFHGYRFARGECRRNRRRSLAWAWGVAAQYVRVTRCTQVRSSQPGTEYGESMMKHEPTAWIEGNEPLVGWAAPKPRQAVTQYINILHAALRDLHAAYPDQRIELRIKEMEPGGWQCYIEFTERDVKMGSESFYINPAEAV